MPQTIGNPLSWSVHVARDTGSHLAEVARRIGAPASETTEMPEIRRIDTADIMAALRAGFDDFVACRSDVIFLCLLYPLIGFGLFYVALDRNLVPLLFPIVSGFALIGPLAAVGLYEMSRNREQGKPTDWRVAFDVLRSPAFGAVFALGLILVALFVVWLFAAQGIYAATLGPTPPATLAAFVADVVATREGWAMTLIGVGTGFLFALAVLAISVVSFPLLLDRDVGLPVAIVTSLRVTMLNPGPIAVWGLIVAGGLALGSLPVFLGLIVVLPVLGHATWHLYRRAVVPPGPATAVG